MEKSSAAKKQKPMGFRPSEELAETIYRRAGKTTRNPANQIEHMLKIADVVIEAFDGIDNLEIIREELAEYRAKKRKGKT